MRTLILVRHAKAEPLGRGDDVDRALAPEGKEDAVRLGAYLARSGHVPQRAFVSTAKRTRQTFDLLAHAFGSSVTAEYAERLYNATETDLRRMAAAADPGVERLMIVGHNPCVMEAAIALTGDGDLEEIGRLRNRFPPCSAAILVFAGEDWTDVATSGGRLEAFVMPEDLGS